MIHVGAEELSSYCVALLIEAGLGAADARSIADCLVEANLRGTDSHGVMRLSIYLPRFKNGAMNPRPSIRPIVQRPSGVLIDGDNGLGHLVGMESMRRVIALARQGGVGFAVARNSNHFGAASYFTLMACEQGMVGIAASNTCLAMPAPGARAAVVGNGPLSIALPASEGDPVCLDISTGAGAYGKILLAAREGNPIPAGWAVDVEGQPTTDPEKAIESQLLLPFAGHKGFGIAFMIDALCAAFGDTWLGADVPNIYEPGRENLPGRVSHIFLAISPDAVGTGSAFGGKVSAMKQLVHNAPAAAGQTPMHPGELQARTRRERLRDGIPLPDGVARDLAALGATNGVIAPWMAPTAD